MICLVFLNSGGHEIIEKINTEKERLCLSYNLLTNLPDSIGDLTQLTKLYFSCNKLTELPDSIGNLAKLIELYLHGNKLTRLPPTIIFLTKIKISDFDNKISNICGNCGKRYHKLSSATKSHNKCFTK